MNKKVNLSILLGATEVEIWGYLLSTVLLLIDEYIIFILIN